MTVVRCVAGCESKYPWCSSAPLQDRDCASYREGRSAGYANLIAA